MPSRRSVRPLTEAEISHLSPARLDAYRRKLQTLEESAESSDLDPLDRHSLDPALIYFKDDLRWTQQMRLVLDRLR